MTYELIETSLDSGKPIRLYKFSRGVTSWGYCTADRDITHLGVKYRSTAVSDNTIRQSGEATADTFEVTLPAAADIAQMYRGVGPSKAIDITVYDMHYGDTEAIISYIGSIYAVKFPAQDRSKIICNTDSISLKLLGLRYTWGRNCNYTVFERGCEVNRDLYKVEALVQSMDGLTISSATFATLDDDWFAGGYVEWQQGVGNFETRGIVSHTGSVLELLGGTEGILLGSTVAVYPGCNGTLSICSGKFSNSDNFGGNPHQPGKSPFDGTPII